MIVIVYTGEQRRNMEDDLRGKFEGKTAVVLGASAEGGIGWATAEALAREGAQVVVGARSEAPLKKLAEQIGGLAVQCDAGDENDIRRLAKAALDAYGRVDIAVQSAGKPVRSLIADLDEEMLTEAARINWFSNVYFIKHMAEAMEADGSIVIISSLASTNSVLPLCAYASAKAASDALVRHAALEYGPRNIRINSILPGPVLTNLGKAHYSTPGVVEAYTRNIPLNRAGLPEDIADAIVWLAGPAFVTGLNLPVNGGMQLSRFPYPDEFPGNASTDTRQ